MTVDRWTSPDPAGVFPTLPEPGRDPFRGKLAVGVFLAGAGAMALVVVALFGILIVVSRWPIRFEKSGLNFRGAASVLVGCAALFLVLRAFRLSRRAPGARDFHGLSMHFVLAAALLAVGVAGHFV